MIRHLRVLAASLRRPRCPYGCGQRVPSPAIARHWWLDHCGDKGIIR